MQYELERSPDAVAFLRNADDVERAERVDHLLSLAEAPVRRSEPTYFPYPPGFQMYPFKLVLERHTNHDTVLFKYAADDQTLWIVRIGTVRGR